MRVSVIQMNQGTDKAANIAQARRLIEARARRRPARTWSPCRRPGPISAAAATRASPRPRCCREPGGTGGAAYEFLRDLAARATASMSMAARSSRGGGEKLFNTTLVFDPDGREIARYRKIHLFDITGARRHRLPRERALRRGDRTGQLPGRRRQASAAPSATTCASPSSTSRCAGMGAEAIFVPSNFTLQTGKDHWEVLLRARAIETQCWIVAAASHGSYEERGATRRSMAIRWSPTPGAMWSPRPATARAGRRRASTPR